MASRDVIRIPVDNDPAVRRVIIPALIARHIAEVGPVPLGIDGKPSTAAVFRWALTLAAAPKVSFAAELTFGPPQRELVPDTGRRFVQVANDGARLKVAREAAQLSQRALADLLGYKDRSAVSLAERGRAPLSASMQLWLDEQEQPGGPRQE